MPQAIPRPRREAIIALRQEGATLAQIATTLEMRERTVREICRRYRLQGPASVETHYDRCGSTGRRFPTPVWEAAVALKREHPCWGGGLIRLQLGEQFPHEPLPAVRTVQRWFLAAGLVPARSVRPVSERARAREAHEVWQIDAKERMRLADGSGTSVLSITDEASGAMVEGIVFSPV